MADRAYIQWLHSQPCAVQPCVSAVQAHHSTNASAAQHDKSVGGRRGRGQRADDSAAFSLCIRHHSEFHDARGHFEGWNKAERAAWQDEQVRRYRAEYEALLEAPASDAQKPGPSPRPTLAQEAAAFCHYHSLGIQIQHDLERLLKKVEQGGTF